jgi:REP-associated tyrosine transposase
VEAEGYPLTLSRYLHLNPVRGKVVGTGDPGERRERLRAWKWSSYGGYSGLAKPEAWISQDLILGEMSGGRSRGGRRLRYRRYVEEGLLREIENPLAEARWQSILGREDFVQQLRDQLESRREEREEIPALRSMRRRADAESIIRSVAKAYRLPVEAVLRRRGKGNEARSVAMVLVWDCCGISLREVGELFGGAGYTAVAQRIARTRASDREGGLRFKLEKLKRKCEK